MWKLQVQPTSESLKHHHHPLFNLYSERERRSSDCVGGTTQTYASSRWCPTPEQLRALEEFYKRGIRTPSTYQIQQITAQLRRFGKIEGKNVFYWFQNHKARERQRIRRRLSMGSSSSVLFSDQSSKQIQDHVFRSFEPKLPKDIQAVQNKSRPTNYAALQEGDRAESDRDGWIKLLIDREIKQISSVKDSNNNSNNNGISPSRHSHVTKGSNLFTSHNSTSSSNEARYYSCTNWQQNEQAMFSKLRRPDKTLELFPIHCEEKANESKGRVQFYEFL